MISYFTAASVFESGVDISHDDGLKLFRSLCEIANNTKRFLSHFHVEWRLKSMSMVALYAGTATCETQVAVKLRSSLYICYDEMNFHNELKRIVEMFE